MHPHIGTVLNNLCNLYVYKDTLVHVFVHIL